EQAFGGELLLALLEQLHQRADAGRLETVDHDLILGRAGKGRQLAGHDDVEALLGSDAHPPERALPDHRLQHSLVVLEAEIDMAGGRRPFEPGHLAAHADVAIGVLDRAPERRGQLRHGPFHNVIEGGLCHSGRISCEGETPCYTKRRPSPKGRLLAPLTSSFSAPVDASTRSPRKRRPARSPTSSIALQATPGSRRRPSAYCS